MSDKSVQITNEMPANVIRIRTFGGFSITYNGNEISFGQQNESQIVHLLQLLLHFREKGVSRDLAKAELFGDRDVEDVSHSIRNIIYNLRKKLREFDFPESQFVAKRSGIYYWTDDIPVEEDAAQFEKSFNEAMAETDTEEEEARSAAQDASISTREDSLRAMSPASGLCMKQRGTGIFWPRLSMPQPS